MITHSLFLNIWLQPNIWFLLSKHILTTSLNLCDLSTHHPFKPGWSHFVAKFCGGGGRGAHQRRRPTLYCLLFSWHYHEVAGPATSCWPTPRFGSLRRMGHYDFFMNGGEAQPGCLLGVDTLNTNSAGEYWMSLWVIRERKIWHFWHF